MAPLLVELSGELQERVYKEINEDPRAVPDQVTQLRLWVKQQPHLPPFDDYNRLVSFLRGCKYNMEKTKKKIDAYFSMRAAAPDIFLNRDPLGPEVQRVWDEVQMLPLSGLTREGQRVVWMHAAKPPINFQSPAALMKLNVMFGDLRLEMEEVGVSGDVYVLDAKYGTMEQFAKFSPAFIRKFITCLKEAYPVRLRGVHVINANPVVEYVLNISKPLLSEKIRDRIHFYGKDLEPFFKHVPREIVPSDCGGTGDCLKVVCAEWRKTVESHRQWFLDQESVVVDESKRPGGPRDYDQLFGVQGNFKKLSID